MWQPGNTLEDIERDAIIKAFRYFQKNKTKTAQALGIAIRTLDAKLEKYLPPTRPGESERELSAYQSKIIKMSEGKTQRSVEESKGVAAGQPVEPHEKISEKQPLPVRKR